MLGISCKQVSDNQKIKLALYQIPILADDITSIKRYIVGYLAMILNGSLFISAFITVCYNLLRGRDVFVSNEISSWLCLTNFVLKGIVVINYHNIK